MRYTPERVRVWLALSVLAGVSGAACTKPVDRAIDRGNSLARDGHLEEAREAYAEATQADPTSARARLLLGNTLMSLKKPTEAATEWQAAQGLPGSREGLAEVALDVGDAGAALEWVAEPTSNRAEVQKARALLALGRPAEALEACERRTGAEALYVKASALLALKRWPEAQVVLETLAREAPGVSLGAYGMARLAAAQGRGADVLLHLKAAKSADGPRWNVEAVAGDPAFAFLSASAEYKELLRSP